MKRKILSLILSVLLCLSLAVSAYAAPDVSFVVDGFGNLADGELAELNELAADIYDTRGIGIFFVFTTEEDLLAYDIDQLVGGMEDYYVMVENASSWYSFMGGKGETLDYETEMELRGIYDAAETYVGGVRDFLNATAEYFPVMEEEPELDDSDAEDFLFDEADLLSDREEKNLREKLREISKEYDAQIVIATIASMEDGDIDDFVEYLYDALDLGYGKHNDGILLLVSMDPRDYRIHCRGMGSDAIGEGDLDAICEAVEAELSDDDYAEAFDVFAEKCTYYLDGYVNGFPFDFATNLVICLIIGLVVGVIGAFILKGQLKSVRKQTGANSYVKAGSMQINIHNDIYLYRDVTRTRKESSSSSSDSGSSRKTGGGSF